MPGRFHESQPYRKTSSRRESAGAFVPEQFVSAQTVIYRLSRRAVLPADQRHGVAADVGFFLF
jgi:hypothetical protein